MPRIRFGTEGWRAVLADDYTFDNLRAVARATGRWFARQPRRAPVAVGHDTRFLGDRFAAAAADELAECGLETKLCTGHLPTPAVAYYVIAEKLAGAAMLTASHNPAEWNGFKIKDPTGAPGAPDNVKWIGDEANRILDGEPPPAPRSASTSASTSRTPTSTASSPSLTARQSHAPSSPSSPTSCTVPDAATLTRCFAGSAAPR